MVKVGLVKEQLGDAGRNRGLAGYLREWLPREVTPLSGVLPGQQQVEFWQVEQGCVPEKDCRKFARRMAKQRMAGPMAWNGVCSSITTVLSLQGDLVFLSL